MKKLLALGVLCIGAASSALAGGLLTNTNQSVHFLRNPARDASTEVDAAYTNPAGTTQLSDGFHFSITNQSVSQTRTITSTFAPFAGNVGNLGVATKEYKGTADAPVVPSFQFAYKEGKWALSGGFAITGGGGKATFANGLASFEAPLAMIPVGLSNPTPPTPAIATTKYSVDGYMEGQQFIYGAQINGSYKITDELSAALGVRVNFVESSYKGHLLNININPVFAGNPTGAMISASTFFTTIGKPANAAATKDIYVDVTQSGMGITPIIGLNYNHRDLNIGMKYELKTSLEVKNKTTVDNTLPQKYPDGATTPNDIPALLTVGAEYKVIPALKLSAGYHHFFDSDAKMANDKQQYINGGVNEILFGAEYDVTDKLLVSAGGQTTNTGVTDAYQTDMSFSLSSYSIGLGAAYKIMPNLKVNVAYFFTNYDKWTKVVTSGYNGTPLGGTDEFMRTNKVIGVGLDYNF
ncbi:MAG: OmpP1/FadL family transporter [Bacteroidales bacterium]